MRQSLLKPVRLVFSLLLFLFITFVFLDFRELTPAALTKTVLAFQFIPSLLRFLTLVSLVAGGFILIILLTLLFGRVYCSFLCPLGVLQDVIGWIQKITSKKHRYRYHVPNNLLRYGFLLITLLFYLSGSILLVNLLDPYSNYGRISTDIFRPVYIATNNTLAGLLEELNIYFLYPVTNRLVSLKTLWYPVLILGLILWLTIRYGRMFCNTVCPVGTLLGLLSRISVFRIRMNHDLCTKCGKCTGACKASCIRVKDLYVDFSRCVACCNCIKVCPDDAIYYSRTLAPAAVPSEIRTGQAPSPPPDTGKSPSSGRRQFFITTSALLTAMAGLSGRLHAGWSNAARSNAGSITSGSRTFGSRTSGSRTFGSITSGSRTSGSNSSTSPGVTEQDLPLSSQPADTVVENKIPTVISEDKHHAVTPPGSLGIKHFTESCTACHLCISACPTDVLQPSFLQFGWSGLMQPFMDYGTNYCNFECTICSEVCPTGAILPLTPKKKKTLQLGRVQLILENCVVYAENTACGSCSEHCPTQAVTMVPYINDLTIPLIKPEICVGCGACEYACPTRPFKAIYVDGHYEHQTARKPEIDPLEETEIEDFPF